MKVKVENLNLQWSDFSLHVRTWGVASGERVLLEGPSGCGKTSFLHAIAGLISPQSGSIWLNDQNFLALSDVARTQLRRQKLSLVFQKIHLLPQLTLSENLQLVSAPSQMEKLDHWLQYFKLNDRRNHLPAQLSQGETQRAAVARALLCNPELLLADEPTSSLDDQNTDLVLRSLLELPKATTVIVVSHDQRLRHGFSRRLDFNQEVRQ